MDKTKLLVFSSDTNIVPKAFLAVLKKIWWMKLHRIVHGVDALGAARRRTTAQRIVDRRIASTYVAA